MFTYKKFFLIIFTAVILLVGIFKVVQPADAAWDFHLVPPNCADSNADTECGVCQAIEVGINITKIMLGTLGSAALLVFVYGGFLMATSRGHTDQVQKGKDALINAVKGVIIVLGSWVVINYGLAVMIQPELDLSKVTLFDNTTNWATVACNTEPTKCEDLKGYSCKTKTNLSSEKQAKCTTKKLCSGEVSNWCCPD